MKVELFPFQKKAVTDLRMKAAEALGSYRRTQTPQVVSLQAPTGAGKTLIMAALVEDIYFGTDQYAEQPEAIFVWLSDSPALNEQSKQKFDLKADRIRFGQCVTIDDASFDMEMLEDGHVYFLNTQKLGKAGNLCRRSDTRQHTIWETLENTAREKADHLYFIIDEAHRGMQGKEAGKATSIMQRFLKGSTEYHLSPMPVVIGISATAARFNKLVGDTNSTLQKCIVTANDVRASGLLKDRIVITYPDDPEKNNEMAVLQAATDEWKLKCDHWYQYSYEQHYKQVNPVFVIQVLAGSGKNVSDTNLDDVIAKIEERIGTQFKENEVVHTFGSTSTLLINGLQVHHVEPPEITDDKRIRVVLFKENLSTGWDCPRAETMMSFRHAVDATYIAQLLGRMVRTPLQCHILVDDSLNDVRLFLPYFNMNTVKNVIDELQNTEGGEIPTVIDGESMDQPVYVPWTVHPPRHRNNQPIEGQMNLFPQSGNAAAEAQPSNFRESNATNGYAITESTDIPQQQIYPQSTPTPMFPIKTDNGKPDEFVSNTGVQMKLPNCYLNREEITKFINDQGLLTYLVRSVKINSYLKSLLNLASLLTQTNIYRDAAVEVKDDVTSMIRSYIESLQSTVKYDELASCVLSFKLSVRIFDVFGEPLDSGIVHDLFTTSESDLDRQLRVADAKIGGYGFPNVYGNRYCNNDDPSVFKVDCILFAADDDCITKLNRYAKKKFHALNDQYRKYVVNKSEKCKKQYSDIIADSDVVSKHNFTLPETINVRVEKVGKEYDNHLFADEKGIAVIKLNGWEEGVLEEEAKRPDFVCWLRNPPREKWSLCIPYEINGEIKATYPDFLIVRSDPILTYVIDILEPHNPDFKDNLGKAKGFAKYAEAEPKIGRIQLIRTGKDPAGKIRFKRLDLSQGAVRDKVLKAQNTDELDHIFETDGIF
ncbi:DEAD/DEAH box helicase [Sporomusa sp.]|uniref:DEAD/DEAH box helicase n=1 Tax=Sporomusa sp. TaxID=2078658 RepID=UPI002BAB62AE|nr:DEAD/DEAH box helicase family protein [Sporomusa sp.]HWR07557.1 DEAD/DEAH box helicase family protein [Sporomusa sp.]